MKQERYFPKQYSILETFSKNTWKNINKLNMIMSAEIDKNLYNELTTRNLSLPSYGFSFYPTYDQNTNILHISPGSCIIQNVMIDILESYDIDLMNSEYYIFNDPIFTQKDGVYRYWVAVYYEGFENPEQPDAYIYLIKSNSKNYAANQERLAIVWPLNVTVVSNRILSVDTDPELYDPNVYDINNPDIISLSTLTNKIDGSWL